MLSSSISTVYDVQLPIFSGFLSSGSEIPFSPSTYSFRTIRTTDFHNEFSHFFSHFSCAVSFIAFRMVTIVGALLSRVRFSNELQRKIIPYNSRAGTRLQAVLFRRISHSRSLSSLTGRLLDFSASFSFTRSDVSCVESRVGTNHLAPANIPCSSDCWQYPWIRAFLVTAFCLQCHDIRTPSCSPHLSINYEQPCK